MIFCWRWEESPNYLNIAKKISYYIILCILTKYNFLLFFSFSIIISYFWPHFLDFVYLFLFPRAQHLSFLPPLYPFLFTTHLVIVSFLLLQQSLIDCSFYSPYNHSELLAHFIFLKGHAFQKSDYCALKPGFLFLFIHNKAIVYFWS